MLSAKACQNYINGPLREHLSQLLRELLESANLAPEAGRIEADPDDPDQQSLLLWYPTVTADGAAYVRRAVKIEAGAKSALDPHATRAVTPYILQTWPKPFLRCLTLRPSIPIGPSGTR